MIAVGALIGTNFKTEKAGGTTPQHFLGERHVNEDKNVQTDSDRQLGRRLLDNKSQWLKCVRPE